MRPEYAGAFACPICLRLITDFDEVTIEHSPPKSLGGRAVALTCRDCNNTAGHTMDWQARQFEHVVDLGRKTLSKESR